MNFTGGPSAGKMSLQGLKKSLGWIVVSVVGGLLVLWFVIKLNDPRFIDWLTRPALADRLKEVEKPRVLVAPATSPNDGVIVPWGSNDTVVIRLDSSTWKGVENTTVGTRTVCEFVTRDVPTEERLEMDNSLIFPIPAPNWNERKHLNMPPAYIKQWRVRLLPGQTATEAIIIVKRVPRT